MLTTEMSPTESFFKSIRVALKFADKVFDEAAQYGRVWDCSWFLATVIREITGAQDLYTGSAAAMAVTGAFCAFCNDVPNIKNPMQIPLLFLYDQEDHDYPQETSHVAIAMPDIDYLSLLGRDGDDGYILQKIVVVDIQDVTPPFKPRVHRASDWFKLTPLSEVRITGFNGLEPPVYPDNKRFAVAPAFLDVKRILDTVALFA